MREASFGETAQPSCGGRGAAALHGLRAPGARELRAAIRAVREPAVADEELDLIAFSSRGSSQPDPATTAAGRRGAAGQGVETTAQWPG